MSLSGPTTNSDIDKEVQLGVKMKFISIIFIHFYAKSESEKVTSKYN